MEEVETLPVLMLQLQKKIVFSSVLVRAGISGDEALGRMSSAMLALQVTGTVAAGGVAGGAGGLEAYGLSSTKRSRLGQVNCMHGLIILMINWPKLLYKVI